jgi:MFS family permease
MAAGSCLLGAGFLVMAVAPVLAVAIAGSAIAGVGNGVQVVAMRTALQEAVPEVWMGVILGLNEAMFQAAPGVGIALGGAIAALSGPRVAFALGAAGSLLVAATMRLKLPSQSPNLADAAAGQKASNSAAPLTAAAPPP